MDRRDFLRLHRSTAAHAGIVLCTFDVDFDGQARRIDAELGSSTDLTGRVIRVNRQG